MIGIQILGSKVTNIHVMPWVNVIQKTNDIFKKLIKFVKETDKNLYPKTAILW